MRRVRRGLAVAAGLVAMACANTVAKAEPIYKESIRHYPVSGQTIDQILQSITQSGPKPDAAGRPTVGRAVPKFTWKWHLATTSGGCRVTDVTVTLEETIILPQWRNRDRAAAPLQAEWDRYYADVLKHERAHAAISLDAARRIERAVLALPARPTCNDVRASIRPTVEAVVREHDALQAAFDLKEGSCRLRKSCLGENMSVR